MSRLLAVACAAAVLAGCAQPEAVPDSGLPTELAAPAQVGSEEPAPLVTPSATAPAPEPSALPSAAPSPTAATSEVAPAPTASQGPASPAPAPRPSATATAAPEPVVLLAVEDRRGDHGLEGPDWVDLRSVELVELGNDLRVTLRFEGELPAAPRAGDVPLIGIDVGDDGYQLFVEGGGEQWSAYLQTPDGFVAYPGTFHVAGRALVLQVPFNTLGSPTRAPVRVLVEWSRQRVALNATAEDRLDGEPHTFDRTA